MSKHKEKEIDTIIKPHCIISACGQELSAEFESIAPLEEAGCKLEVVCDNGVGFQHVVTASGKHYAILDRNKGDLISRV